jgi:hypothetical protein
MTLNRWMAGTLGFVLLASTAAGREGIVKTRDGRSISGDITETDDGVSINARGVVLNLTASQIAGVEYPESIDVQYQERLGKLAADDVKGRLDLARWAFEQQEYTLSRDAAQQALDIDANSTEAVTMLNTIRVQMRLEQNKADADALTDEATNDSEMPDDETAVDDSDQPVPIDRRVERRLLTNDDINRIRQAELKPTDNAVRIRFDNDVENRFINATNQNASIFRNLRPIQKAEAIINDENPEFREDVRILSDPQAMMDFRRQVQPLVLNGCAAMACHGGINGGELILFSPSDSDGTAYTNFYILDQFAVAGADTTQVFGKGEQRMIDRANPDQSLLLQYAIPADQSDADHPPVRGWRAIFRNMQDPRYQQTLNWIARGLKPVQPDYEIEYVPPTGQSAEEATEPQPDAPAAPDATQPAPGDG